MSNLFDSVPICLVGVENGNYFFFDRFRPFLFLTTPLFKPIWPPRGARIRSPVPAQFLSTSHLLRALAPQHPPTSAAFPAPVSPSPDGPMTGEISSCADGFVCAFAHRKALIVAMKGPLDPRSHSVEATRRGNYTFFMYCQLSLSEVFCIIFAG